MATPKKKSVAKKTPAKKKPPAQKTQAKKKPVAKKIPAKKKPTEKAPVKKKAPAKKNGALPRTNVRAITNGSTAASSSATLTSVRVVPLNAKSVTSTNTKAKVIYETIKSNFINLDNASFAEWMANGIKKGWCGPPVCYLHDGLPMSDEEAAELDEGSDPCMHVVRMYDSEEHKNAIEESHSPSEWRNHYGD